MGTRKTTEEAIAAERGPASMQAAAPDHQRLLSGREDQGFVLGAAILAVFYALSQYNYTTQTGMTTFEQVSRGLSCAAFLAAAGLLAAKRGNLDARVFRLLLVSLLMGAASELASAASRDFYGALKVFAHLSEVASLYLICKAFVEAGLTKPYDLVFRSHKEAQSRLEQAKEMAESAVRAKSEFLANMSHEIRTPMTAILGYAEILADSVDRPELQEAVQTVKRNSSHLLGLVNDILDLSKIESGRVQVEHLPVSPLAILGDVVSLMRVRSEAKRLPLKLEYCGPIPQTIQTDPTRLRQILVNLVGNAIKFTETGGVTIAVRLLDRHGAEPKLECRVIDTGAGISPEDIEHLFQPFQQADASATRKFGGTGLGLAVSKRLAKLLGGDVTASSALGKGSTFTLTIASGPLEDAALIDQPAEAMARTAAKSKPAAAPLARLDGRILLAEDGPDNQRMIAFILRKMGADVHICDNGQKAMEEALAALGHHVPMVAVEGDRPQDDSKGPFDLILMDMQMPVMDGYEATRQLRQRGYTGPILALTAHAMKGDMQKCLDAGCDAYLTKPIEREQFLSTIAGYLRASCTHGRPAASNEAVATPTPTRSTGCPAGCPAARQTP